jgi:hypothetical protein
MSGREASFFISFLLLANESLSAATYYVEPNGNDNNSGKTTDNPFASLNKFNSAAAPGDTCYMRDGHRLEYCMAADSAYAGVSNNSGQVKQTLYNCTGYFNNPNYNLGDALAHRLRNGISYKTKNYPNWLSGTIEDDSNSWTLAV